MNTREFQSNPSTLGIHDECLHIGNFANHPHQIVKIPDVDRLNERGLYYPKNGRVHLRCQRFAKYRKYNDRQVCLSAEFATRAPNFAFDDIAIHVFQGRI